MVSLPLELTYEQWILLYFSMIKRKTPFAYRYKGKLVCFYGDKPYFVFYRVKDKYYMINTKTDVGLMQKIIRKIFNWFKIRKELKERKQRDEAVK